MLGRLCTAGRTGAVIRARTFGGLAALACFLAGCASVPRHRYGVYDIAWKGVDAMSEDALEACLATKERQAVSLRLGLGSDNCLDPPFDEQAPSAALFWWPWTEWPVYDEAIFEIDRRRIERFYRARGYYDARIENIEYRARGQKIAEPARCTADDCQLEIEIAVVEGEPVHVTSIVIESESPLPAELEADLLEVAQLEPGGRFDEAVYEGDKRHLVDALREAGYARAVVAGVVELDRVRRTAVVRYRINPGPLCQFGDIAVHGQGDLSAEVILGVANLKRGEPFRRGLLIDAERAVYSLGAFGTVRAEPQLEGTSGSVIDVVIRVVPGRRRSVRLGVGVMSGVLNAAGSDELVAVPEWDIHLRAGYRNENFLGGMRRLRFEDRPRLILLDRFPQVPSSGPRLGNALDLSFEQPRFIEARTTLIARGYWDVGPDPFLRFFRHVVTTKLGLRRAWFDSRLHVTASLAHDLYEILDDTPPDSVSSYRLPFLDQQIRLDLRNHAQRPTRGVYLATSAQQTVRLGYGSWTYVRILPEARAYQRLPLGIVLAQRIALGALFIFDRDRELDPTSQRLGPQEYRLRGGGANSNRGFAPGQLGAGIQGGQRRWEASVEARVPIGAAVGFVLFFDVGDVSESTRFRFNHLNAATGFGLRYFTPFAPIRLDFGWRIPGLQAINAVVESIELSAWPSAAHLTIGEAF